MEREWDRGERGGRDRGERKEGGKDVWIDGWMDGMGWLDSWLVSSFHSACSFISKKITLLIGT